MRICFDALKADQVLFSTTNRYGTVIVRGVSPDLINHDLAGYWCLVFARSVWHPTLMSNNHNAHRDNQDALLPN